MRLHVCNKIAQIAQYLARKVAQNVDLLVFRDLLGFLVHHLRQELNRLETHCLSALWHE